MGSCASSSQVANVVTSTKTHDADLKKNTRLPKPDRSAKTTPIENRAKAGKPENPEVTLAPEAPPEPTPILSTIAPEPAPQMKTIIESKETELNPKRLTEENGDIVPPLGPAAFPEGDQREGSTLTDVVSQTQLILTDQVSENLHTLNEEDARLWGLKPGQKLCYNCEQSMKRSPPHFSAEPFSSSADDAAIASAEESFQSLEAGTEALGVTPMKQIRSVKYAKRKVKDIHTTVKKKVAKILYVDSDELSSSSENDDKSHDFDELIHLLKEKCTVSTRRDKIKLLTMAPKSWSVRKVADVFNVSRYIANKSRTLRDEKGILAEYEPKKGKVLSADICERVVEFYQSDEYSRQCPGKKDYVSVVIDGMKVQKQKRLLLVNLKELYLEYLQKHSDKIGFSKFAELRPKWCVSVNSAGMHSVCVCQHHQNAKLLVSALPQHQNYKDLLCKIVCSTENRQCMLHLCENCPGKENLHDYLLSLFSDNDIEYGDTITYKQWIHTDHTDLKTLQEPLSEFLNLVCDKFDDLRKHHYITKSQSAYLQDLKENLSPNEAIVLLDFAENYSFLVQDAVQGHHWDNSQATLHPFAIYCKESETLKCMSVCIISDSLKHDQSAVHAFTSKLFPYLKEAIPSLQKVVYFSDGAASQYKNFKNFVNLCYHKEDRGVEAEWHFFATSHGKSPCDGIGGTVKRLCARASLQAPVLNQILTAEDMFNWSNSHIDGIKFFFVSDEDIQSNSQLFDLESRYASASTIPGTRSHHSFIPRDDGMVEMRRVSADTIFSTASVGIAEKAFDTEMYQPGKYIACMYDAEWYIGCIVDRSNENQDVLVDFMKRSRTHTLSWPDKSRDRCWVPFRHIICIISVPSVTGRGARHYSLSDSDFERIQSLLPNFC